MVALALAKNHHLKAKVHIDAARTTDAIREVDLYTVKGELHRARAARLDEQAQRRRRTPSANAGPRSSRLTARLR